MAEKLASKWFRGADLGDYGLVTSEVSGIFSVSGYSVSRLRLPGRDAPSDRGQYGELESVVWKCVVSADTHEQLVRRLRALRGLLHPRLGWGEMRIENRPLERTFARCLGWPVAIDSLPYQQRVVQFTLTFERYPYWEDLVPQIVTGTTIETIENTGDLEAYPTYTCTFAAALPSGFWFSVNGRTHTHTGARQIGDTVVIDTDLGDVETNGARDFAHTHPDSEFPYLDVGENTLAKSSADLVVSTSFRRRYT